MRIGVIGAGHAGVEAAHAASRAGANVVLFSAESALPYYRPRLVAVACGHDDENAIVMHPAAWYAERGIDLRLASAVEKLDVRTTTVVSDGEKAAFDALVIATGAGPAIPPFARSAGECAVPLWNIQDARRIRDRVRPRGGLIIVGGGVIGIELALRAADSGMHVTIVEKMERLMSQDFGRRASALIRRELEQKGIRLLTDRTALSATRRGDGKVLLEMEGEPAIEGDLALFSVGVARDLALAKQAGLETGAGIMAEATLQTSAAAVYACGDIVQFHEGRPRCSASEAAAQGRIAGFNACAVASGKARKRHALSETPLTLKYKSFEICSIGAIPDESTEEEPLDGSSGNALRTRVLRNGVTVGIQMVGGRKDFQKYAKEIQEARYDGT